MSNLEWLEKMLQVAKNNLHDVEELQKKYPESFGLKISAKGWKSHIIELNKKIDAEKKRKEMN